MTKPLMEFQILIQKGKISRLESPYGKAVVIPFEGYVSSELFTGRILPGAADVQTTDAAGIRHMCAKYMFEGTDSSGRFCHLFVENNGYFEKDSHPEIFHACPSFLSDSPLLSEKLSGPWFRAEGHPSDAGVVIKIFDVREAEEEISYPPLRKGKDPALIRDELAETYESLSEERKRFVSEAAEKIKAQGDIRQAVFYNEKDAGTYVYEAGRDDISLTSLIGALYDSANILFLIIDERLCALYSTVGKIHDIPDDALMIFQQMLEMRSGENVFERPLNRMRKIRLFG